MLGLNGDEIRISFWREYDEHYRSKGIGVKTFFHHWNSEYLNPLLISHLELEPGHAFSTNLLYFLISDPEDVEQ